MKTTLVIADAVMEKLRAEAARQNRTLSDLVESALRQYFRPRKENRELPPLPSWHGGEVLVDINDREALDRVMDED